MKKISLIVLLFVAGPVVSWGQGWSPVGAGMNVNGMPQVGFVYALDTLNGNLYAGGTFDSAGGIVAKGIAQWNGLKWSAVGSGLNDLSLTYKLGVFAMVIYKGNLYIGGVFDSAGGVPVNNIAEWNGANWLSLGSGTDGEVRSLMVYNGNLYAGGSFKNAGGSPANEIAMWNGSAWSSVDKGMNPGSYPSVCALTVYNGNLYAGGSFDTVNGAPMKYISMWNGTTWTSVGGGVYGFSYGQVSSLYVFDGNLYVGGIFDSAGGTFTDDITEWNGSSWTSLTQGDYGQYSTAANVQAINAWNGNLYTGGLYDSAGNGAAYNVAEWDGSIWDTLSRGITGGQEFENGFSGFSEIHALISYKGSLYAGGAFTMAGHTQAYNIARWGYPTGIDELTSSNDQIKVYPNPSNGVITVEEQGVRDKEQVIEVYNMLGEKIFQHSFSALRTTLDLSCQPAGVYLYRVVSEKGELLGSGKLIIE